MRFSKINTAKFGVVSLYYKSYRGGNYSVGPNYTVPQLLPSLVSFLASSQNFLFGRTVYQFDADALLRGYNYGVLGSNEPTLPLPDSLMQTIVQEPSKVPTKRFSRRKAAGEIIMNPYSVSTVKIQQTAEYDLSKSKLVTPGGLGASVTLYGAQAPFLSSYCSDIPTLGKRDARDTFHKISFFLYYDIYETLSPVTVALSPYPIIELNKDFGIDTELVTEAVAARNAGVYDLLTELGELPETLSFVTDLTKKAFLLTDEAEQTERTLRKKYSGVKVLRKVSALWMSVRYGLLPIFYSIQDMSEVLKQLHRSYAEFKSSKTDDSVVSDVSCLEPVVISVTGGSVKHRCFVKSHYSPDTLLAELRRVINVNIVSTAWELTSKSFVYDWVINFGDFLSAATGSDGSDDSKCCYSTKDTRVVSVKRDIPGMAPLVTTVTFDQYRRSVINPSDHIGLSFRYELGWKRYIDAAAMSLDPVLKIVKTRRRHV